MSTTAPKPVTTPIPVQLSEPEFTAFILPHLSMPKRGPKCKLGYYRVFNLILWVLYTGMQWKCSHSTEFSGGAPPPFVIPLQLCSLTPILGHHLQRPSAQRVTHAQYNSPDPQKPDHHRRFSRRSH